MSKKILMGIIVIIVIILGFVAFNGSGQDSKTNEVFKIGLSLPLTGNAGFLGEAARKAAQMAVVDAGKTKYQYELVFEDDSFDPKKTVTNMNKYISLDKVSAIVTFGSGTSNAAAPITEKAGIPRFGLASDPTSAEGEYNFIHWTPPFKEGALIAEQISKLGYKNVSIIDVNHPGPLAVSNAVEKSLKEKGINVISKEMTNVGDKDFKTVIGNIKAKNPDIVVITIFSPEIEILTKQMRELGMNTPITAAETFEWSDQPELFEGMWFVSDARVNENFASNFEKNYKDNPKPGSAYVYDLVSFIIQVQEKQDHKLTPQELQKVISEMDSYKSSVFGNVPIDDEGFFITDASLKIIKNGKPEQLK